MYQKPVLKSLNVFVFSLSEISAVLLIKGGWWVAWSIIGPTGPSAAQTKLNSLRKTIAQSTSGKTQSTSGHSNPLQEKHLAHSQITEITFLRNYHLCWSPTWSIQHSRLRGHDQLSGPAEFLECLENHSKKTATFGVTNISFTSSLAQKGEFPLQLDFLKYAVLSKWRKDLTKKSVNVPTMVVTTTECQSPVDSRTFSVSPSLSGEDSEAPLVKMTSEAKSQKNTFSIVSTTNVERSGVVLLRKRSAQKGEIWRIDLFSTDLI